MSNIIKKYFEESKYFSMKLEKYFHVYELILSKYKLKKDLTVVEIGVKDGGSLFIWKKLFPHAKVIGIDLNIECKKFEIKIDGVQNITMQGKVLYKNPNPPPVSLDNVVGYNTYLDVSDVKSLSFDIIENEEDE